MSTAILISTYRRPNMLRGLLENIKKTVDININPVFVMYNDDDELTRPEEFDSAEFVLCDGNIGLRDAINKGLDRAFKENTDFITYLQDDVILRDGWLEDCIIAWNEYKDIYKVGLITGHEAPEHPAHLLFDGMRLQKTCRATHLFASTERWKEFGFMPKVTEEPAPRNGRGSLEDWWLCGHPQMKYPESEKSLRKKDENVLCLPGRVIHAAPTNSTWGISNPEWWYVQ